jgi:hypothetical protein
MKAIIKKDNRSSADRKFDDMWNKMVRDAKINPTQERIIGSYLRELLVIRVHETQSADDMSWLLSLIEGEHYGTSIKHGAIRLLRAQAKSAEIRNDAYSHSCIDANGVFQKYDGCGLEYLQNRLKSHEVEYDINI